MRRRPRRDARRDTHVAERDPRLLHGRVRCNGVPHFVKGITEESYPGVFGNSPVPNLIAGGFSFIIAAPFGHFADLQHYALPFQLAGAVGALGFGLIHAAISAFGR